MSIQWIGSPNYDTNRRPIKRVIIHWIVGNLAAADAVFQDTNRGTSAHYAIEDDTIHQYVKEEYVAYHAGNYPINQESIGIEHSASPDRAASEATYKTSAKLIALICERYGIPIDRDHIEPHNKYRATQCPGSINIDKLIELAKQTDEPDYKRLYEDTKQEKDKMQKELDETKVQLAQCQDEIKRYELRISDAEAIINNARAENAVLEKQLFECKEENKTSTPPEEVPTEESTEEIPPNQSQMTLAQWLSGLWQKLFKNG